LKDFEKERVESVLNTIFDMNVMRYGEGKIGAVNGMTSSGQLEIVSMQSEEIWTGVTYGLTSTMIMEVGNINKSQEIFLSFYRI
jgi:non-lysosomal glucosylceramidase